MSSAVDSGYARYEELQKEWDCLKREMDNLVLSLAKRTSGDLSTRKSVVEKRMQEITLEMTDVLSAARQAMPSSEVSTAESMSLAKEMTTTDLWLGIIRRKRLARDRVERTYDSTDSESEFSVDAALDAENNATSSSKLRESMRQEALSRNPNLQYHVLTVENPADGARRRYGQVTGAQAVTKPAGGNHAGKSPNHGEQNFDTPSNACTPQIGSPTSPEPSDRDRVFNRRQTEAMTDEDRLAMSLEFSRLERRARNLKGQEVRSEDEEEELNGAVSRINELRKWLGNVGLTPHHNSTKTSIFEKGEQNDSRSPNSIRWFRKEDDAVGGAPTTREKHMKNPFHSAQTKPSTPVGRKEQLEDDDDKSSEVPKISAEDLGLELDENLEMEEEYEGPRKKALQGIEAGVASVRAFGRKLVRHAGDGGDTGGNGGNNGGGRAGVLHTPRSFLTRGTGAKAASSTRASTGSSSPFAQVTDMLSKRGEKLNGLSGQTEEMSNNASDMLSAAQALRKRQQKKHGFFK